MLAQVNLIFLIQIIRYIFLLPNYLKPHTALYLVQISLQLTKYQNIPLVYHV